MKQTTEARAEARFSHEKPYPDQFSAKYGYATCIREEVEPREAEIERLRALVQRFVDHNYKWLGKTCTEADLQRDAIVSDTQE